MNVQLIYESLRRGMWTASVSSHAQGVDSILAGNGPAICRAVTRAPQHCPACAQLRCAFTQVIHRFVHREACLPADGKLPARQAASRRKRGAAGKWPPCGLKVTFPGGTGKRDLEGSGGCDGPGRGMIARDRTGGSRAPEKQARTPAQSCRRCCVVPSLRTPAHDRDASLVQMVSARSSKSMRSLWRSGVSVAMS